MILMFAAVAAFATIGRVPAPVAPGYTEGARTASRASRGAPSLLTIKGVGDQPVTLTMADLEKLAQITVKARDHGGEEANYEGASLADVMKRAGMDLAADQHGRGLTRYLLAEAADHYHILFALPEFDPEFTDRHILVAYRKDGKPLSPTEGPLRLIVPDDKRQARWLRSLTTLTIADSVPPYERNKKP